MTPERMQRQRHLEQLGVGLGVARYYERHAEGDTEKSEPGKALLRRMIEPLGAAIQAWRVAALSGEATRNAGLAHFLNQFDDPEDIAFIVARHALSALTGVMGAWRLTTAAASVGKRLEEASMSEILRQKDPKGFHKLQRKIDTCPFPGKRYVMARDQMGKSGVKRITWGASERVRLGAMLLALCSETTGLFTIENRREGKQTIAYMQANEESKNWLELQHQQCSLRAPHYLPMVIPPLPWKGVTGGGYLDQRGLRIDLVRSYRQRKAYMEELRNNEMPMVFAALNAVQATPWRINKPVLDVLKVVWESGRPLGKLPPREKLPIPEAPWGDGPPPNEQALKDLKGRRARAYEANDRAIAKRRSMFAKLETAERMVNDPEIYFPHALDFRGRVYPLPPFVNPQADDSGRALLTFARPVELGEEGAYWLAVHGANTFGIDKVSFEERVQWVEQNHSAILDCVEDPLANTLWSDAEDPWLFLAFCFEWSALNDWVAAGNAQETFPSHLPVSWDGSCNGLQNFSAMLRDPVGAAATNLVPSEQPADIYAQVAAVASKAVERDAARGEVNARYWLGKVTRKIAKRPTMTLPYGSGRFGFTNQLQEELTKHKLIADKTYIHGDELMTCRYLAGVLFDSLGAVVVSAMSAMEWLREVARVVSSQGLPVWWKTPSGWLVMQDYREYYGKKLDFTCGGARRTIDLRIEKDELDKRRQAQGISPNFVHSLDAAHLMRTVVKGGEAGITSWAMVHDSYGAHAGHATTLHRVLREAFVEQYSENVLVDFARQIANQLPPEVAEKIPPVPAMGTLDLELVKSSDYFFA